MFINQTVGQRNTKGREPINLYWLTLAPECKVIKQNLNYFY